MLTSLDVVMMNLMQVLELNVYSIGMDMFSTLLCNSTIGNILIVLHATDDFGYSSIVKIYGECKGLEIRYSTFAA